MLPMLTVTGAPGLLYLNGRFCGETGAAAMPLSRDGVQYLEVRPFDPGKRGAVLRLRLAQGRLVEGVSGEAFAVQWPGGWIALEVRDGPDRDGPDGDELARAEAAPLLLAQLDMPGGRYLLVDEGGVPSFGREAEEAIFLPVTGVQDASLRTLPYPGLCAVEGECAGGRFAAVLRAQGEPLLVECCVGVSAGVDAQGAITCVESAEDLVGHANILVFAPDAQGQYAPRSRDAGWLPGGPRWPGTPRDTARAFLEALLFGAFREAAGYLERPEEAQALFQAIGPFSAVTALPEDGSQSVMWGVVTVDAPNLATVRRLGFSLARLPSEQGEWKIVEVTEGHAPE